MAPPLEYFLITVKVVSLEKVSFSDTQIPKGVCLHIGSHDKYYLLNGGNLLQTIKMQLCQKQKSFCVVFFFFLHF